jgi:hypothetical protein
MNIRRLLMAFAAVLLVAAASCGARTATAGFESECAPLLQVRQEALDRVDREHDAAVAKRPDRRAAADGVQAETDKAIRDAADLRRCEDNDPNTGVVMDVADLRQRLAVVVDRGVEQLNALPAPVQPKPADTRHGGDGGGDNGGGPGHG